MTKPFIPRPCIRRVDLPTGEKFAIELTGGHILATFVREEAARIYAKALNCETGPAAEPCNACDACTAITAGQDVDVVEIDPVVVEVARSHFGLIEDARLRVHVDDGRRFVERAEARWIGAQEALEAAGGAAGGQN
jgi:hypothetical protein